MEKTLITRVGLGNLIANSLSFRALDFNFLKFLLLLGNTSPSVIHQPEVLYLFGGPGHGRTHQLNGTGRWD